MKSNPATTPTLLTRPTRACPRCDDNRIRAQGDDELGAFDWYECQQCGHLWAIPHGWKPHAVSHVARIPQ